MKIDIFDIKPHRNGTDPWNFVDIILFRWHEESTHPIHYHAMVAIRVPESPELRVLPVQSKDTAWHDEAYQPILREAIQEYARHRELLISRLSYCSMPT